LPGGAVSAINGSKHGDNFHKLGYIYPTTMAVFPLNMLLTSKYIVYIVIVIFAIITLAA
jgi:hypothetical protein